MFTCVLWVWHDVCVCEYKEAVAQMTCCWRCMANAEKKSCCLVVEGRHLYYVSLGTVPTNCLKCRQVLGPVSWRRTTIKWLQFSQSKSHSIIGTWQTKRYHRWRTTRWGVTVCSPMMVALHDTWFVECQWWNDGWTVKTSLDGRLPPWYRPLVLQSQSWGFRILWMGRIDISVISPAQR